MIRHVVNATPGDIEGFRVVHFEAEDMAQPLPNHGERFAQPYLDLVPPFVSLSRPPYEYIHQNDLYIPIEGRSEVLSTIAITVTPRQTGQPTMTAQTTSSPVGNWYAGVTLPGEGIFDILVRATDQIGNVGPAAASVVIIDASPPTVTVSARREGYTSIVVEWQGADTGSGVRSYDVQYAVDAPNNWQDWLFDTPQTQTSFGGEFGHSYYFRVQARDRAGNESSWVEVGPLSVELGEVKKYYSFGGQRVAMREGDDVYYLSGDHLGSVSLTTDAGGAVVAQARYLPYGEERWVSGTSPTDFGFTSQRSEASFGLMDYNARYYSPYLNRFISPDMIVPEPGGSQGWNRYSYVMNNPVRYSDPTGHCPGCDNPSQVMLYERFDDRALTAHISSQYYGPSPSKSSLERAIDVAKLWMLPFSIALGPEAAMLEVLAQGYEIEMDQLPPGVQVGVVAPVGYGSTDLSIMAQEFRLANKLATGNVAVFEYLDEAGSLQTLTRSNIEGQLFGGHSEQVIARELGQMEIDPSQVTRIYSELEPCSIGPNYCKNFIQKTFTEADVTYSFEYGASPDSRRRGVQQLETAVNRLFNLFFD